ncbi:alpha,alpha-trehalase [soil metagenome]
MDMIFKKINKEMLKSSVVSSSARFTRPTKSPEDGLKDLFNDVQKQHIYIDSKTFLDLVPKARARQLNREYKLAKQDPNFNLSEFVRRHFYELSTVISRQPFEFNDAETITNHVSRLWTELERRNRRNRGSLIALPYPYVVPGGRFDEQYYWDSYFIMLGLATDNRWDAIESMVKNFAYMIRKFGFIPTANRTYFLSRSQPPFFSHMIRLLAGKRGKSVLALYLPYLLKEYHFWMKGKAKLAKQEHHASGRLVQINRRSYLNRYYDNKLTPRPESLREDTTTAERAIDREADRLYLHLRAGAESGWDFSSRWFSDPSDISTIHTADIIPVDLNCLLYELEQTIADGYGVLRQPLLRHKYKKLAKKREQLINRYCWDDKTGFYGDYNFHHKHMTGRLTLAGVFPLYASIASKDQAALVAQKLESDFLRQGGLTTTLFETGQQWDAPNGWAPLHWITIVGLRNYGYDELANTIKARWIATNSIVYRDHHKLVEKYDVVDGNDLGGGGEYPVQDGFGWTNGVLQALLDEDT